MHARCPPGTSSHLQANWWVVISFHFHSPPCFQVCFIFVLLCSLPPVLPVIWLFQGTRRKPIWPLCPPALTVQGAWEASWEDSNFSHQFTCSGVVLRYPIILNFHGVWWGTPPLSSGQSSVRLSDTKNLYAAPVLTSTLPVRALAHGGSHETLFSVSMLLQPRGKSTGSGTKSTGTCEIIDWLTRNLLPDVISQSKIVIAWYYGQSFYFSVVVVTWFFLLCFCWLPFSPNLIPIAFRTVVVL